MPVGQREPNHFYITVRFHSKQRRDSYGLWPGPGL